MEKFDARFGFWISASRGTREFSAFEMQKKRVGLAEREDEERRPTLSGTLFYEVGRSCQIKKYINAKKNLAVWSGSQVESAGQLLYEALEA
jgi:hypothetical protein